MRLKHEIFEPDVETMSNNMAEADHRIANHLAMLSGYVRLRGARLVEGGKAPSAEDVRCLTRLIVAQIDAISDLHRLLSDQGHPDTLDLSVPLLRICTAMQAGVAGEIAIVASLDKGCDLPLKAILPITQICAEIITNAIKHGCTCTGQGTIRVACRKGSGGTVIVEVSDTGPGLPDTSQSIRKDGLGLRLIDALIRQVDGRIDYGSTSQGMTVRVELPAGQAVGAATGCPLPEPIQGLNAPPCGVTVAFAFGPAMMPR
jgi:two-component sensor histidine kinase